MTYHFASEYIYTIHVPSLNTDDDYNFCLFPIPDIINPSPNSNTSPPKSNIMYSSQPMSSTSSFIRGNVLNTADGKNTDPKSDWSITDTTPNRDITTSTNDYSTRFSTEISTQNKFSTAVTFPPGNNFSKYWGSRRRAQIR